VLPEIDILGLSVKTFGLFFALNFAAWGLVAAKRLKELGKPVDWAYEMVVAALLGGLIGAKLWWAVEEGELSLSGLFSGSGLTWYGGLLGGALAIYAWAKYRRFWTPQLLDFCGIGLALGYAVGRIGCQVSGDGDYGVASDLPWAMAFPEGVVPTDEVVHPAPIYESLAMGTVALVLWHLRDRFRPGTIFGLYLVLAAVERFLVEFIRRNDDTALGLTSAQLFSLALLALGAVALAFSTQALRQEAR
jgi:phosphatidylglycerol:prolipoprotein diacylglycerol transferase